MSQSDILTAPAKPSADKTERLFAASISAYCSLTRPSREEAQQLEVLTLPLYEHVSDETLRYVAAALSECAHPPRRLVMRLCGERPEISAPLLVKTNVLTDGDLVSLIADHGAPHARVISRRKALHPLIDRLVRLVLYQSNAALNAPAHEQTKTTGNLRAEPAPPARKALGNAEETREALRAMMRPAGAVAKITADSYPALRAAALSGDRERLAEILADALDVDTDSAAELLRPSETQMLTTALRSLALTGEQALLVLGCVAPDQFGSLIAIRGFVEAFSARKIGDARQVVELLRNEERAIRASNTSEPPEPLRALSA